MKKHHLSDSSIFAKKKRRDVGIGGLKVEKIIAIPGLALHEGLTMPLGGGRRGA